MNFFLIAQPQEKSSLTSDYDRKYAELTRTLEQRSKLDEQLAKLSQQLSDIAEERKRGEKELGLIQTHLKQNTELVDELNGDMEDVREGELLLVLGGARCSCLVMGSSGANRNFKISNTHPRMHRPQASNNPWRTTWPPSPGRGLSTVPAAPPGRRWRLLPKTKTTWRGRMRPPRQRTAAPETDSSETRLNSLRLHAVSATCEQTFWPS